jgi:hypothetical protein
MKYQKIDFFFFRLGIGVGGLINTRKIELVHMVLKDIAMFHNRHRRQPLFKCCNDFNRMKSSTQSIIPEMKDKHSATVSASTTGENSTDKRIKLKYNRQQSFPCTSTTINDYDQRRLANIAIKVIGDNDIANVNEEDETKLGTNLILPYRSTLDVDEPETFYCLNVSFYQPISQPKHNHEVSLLSMHHIIDFNNLQMLRLVFFLNIYFFLNFVL